MKRIALLVFLFFVVNAGEEYRKQLVTISKNIQDELYFDSGLTQKQQENNQKGDGIWNQSLENVAKFSEDKKTISSFSVSLKEKFLDPLIFLKMGNENLYSDTMNLVNSFTDTKIIFEPEIKKKFIDAVRDYVEKFSLITSFFNIQIKGTPICNQEICDEGSSNRWSLIIYDYLAGKSDKKFTVQDDAEEAFFVVIKTAEKNSEIDEFSRDRVSTFRAFKDFLITMFTQQQALSVLSTYSSSFEINDDVQRFINYYFLNLSNSVNDVYSSFEKLLEKAKKPELLAQFLYFCFVITTVDQSEIYHQFRSNFKQYLANKLENFKDDSCCKLFSHLLVKIKESNALEKILLNVEKLNIDYARQIKMKINALESAEREKRIKEYLNPLYSFLTTHKKKLGTFAVIFFAFYFDYLQKALKRVKALKLFEKQQNQKPSES